MTTYLTYSAGYVHALSSSCEIVMMATCSNSHTEQTPAPTMPYLVIKNAIIGHQQCHIWSSTVSCLVLPAAKKWRRDDCMSNTSTASWNLKTNECT